MTRWLQRVRGAVGMGVTWALGWAVAGLLIGASSLVFPGPLWDAFFRVYDAPLPTLGVPGFFGGALFSLVLGIAGRRRRFDELSLPRFATWGAIGGLLLCLVPLTLAGIGLLTGGSGTSLVSATMVVAVPFALLGAASSGASLALARRSPSPPLLRDVHPRLDVLEVGHDGERHHDQQ